MKINFDKVFFYLIIVDILFLPYVSFISTNYSLPIVFLWFIFSWKKINKKYNFVFLMMIFISLLSTLFSFVLYPKYLNGVEIYIKNINLFIQYTSYIVYFVMFKYYIEKYHPKISSFLICFVIFAFVFCLLFYYDKTLFASIKLFWNHSDFFTDSFLSNSLYAVYRYNFIWTDPNNVAYGIVMVVTFLLLDDSIKPFIKALLFIMQLVVLIATMSVGGFISLFIVIVLFTIFNFNKIFFSFNIGSKIITLLIIASIGIVIYNNYQKLTDNVIYMEAMNRISNNEEGYDSRFTIWDSLVKNTSFYEYLFFGKGGQTIVDNHVVKPHSGHFLLILSYGLLYYFCFLKSYFMFDIKKTKYYLYIIPIFIGFTVNTLIGEQKLFILYLLLFLISTFITNNYGEVVNNE